MKKLAGIIIICLSLIACNNNNSKETGADKGYQKATETLLQKEKKNRLAFLIVSSRDKHNLLGQTVIKGSLNNIAKVCIYKDVQLELSFFSKTGALLEKDLETVYDLIEPGKTTPFKTKYFAPKGTDSVAIKIVSAKVKE